LRCGYVALLGRPNAGKSTLLNALVGQKISGVSAKAQTTRNRITGVVMHEDTQILILDTPGLHRKEPHEINRMMNKLSYSTFQNTDLICYLIDGVRGWHAEDVFFLSKILTETSVPLLFLVSKADKLAREDKQTMLAEIKAKIAETAGPAFDKSERSYALRLFSAKSPEMLAEFKAELAERMPEGPWLFDSEQLTDLSERFVASEMIREQLFRQLGEEIPYGCAAVVEKITVEERIVTIFADIYVARDSQKGVVIGKKGSRLSSIGSESRKTLERHFGKQVNLQLHVRVKENWMDSERLVRELSYLGEDLD